MISGMLVKTKVRSNNVNQYGWIDMCGVCKVVEGGKYWLWVNIKSEIACDQIFRTPLPQNFKFLHIGNPYYKSELSSCRPWSIPCKPHATHSFFYLLECWEICQNIVVMQKHYLGTHGHCTLYNWNCGLKPKLQPPIIALKILKVHFFGTPCRS